MSSRLATDVAGFFRAWLNDPMRIAAPVPSSQSLARAITSEITSETVPVIELGAGTGVFTQALIDRGVPQDRLALIDSRPDFASALQRRFPAAETLCVDATRLRETELFGGEPAAVLVSGLPLLSMSARQVIAILDGAFSHLRPDAAFYQFTYGPRCPVPRVLLDRLGLKAVRIGGTLANIPPALVYRIRQRRPRAGVSATTPVEAMAAGDGS